MNIISEIRWIAVSAIIGASIVSAAYVCSKNEDSGKMREFTWDDVEEKHEPDRRTCNRYQMQIVTDKGANWNGIYVLDKETGRVRFYPATQYLDQ